MTILRSPSGSWVNVRDRKKVFIYIRWGWTVFTDEEAEALFFITSAGLEEKEALDMLEVSARAAAAGLGDIATIADAVTSAANAYGPAMGRT